MNKNLFILLAVVTACLLFRLGSWGVTETSEARYAEIGRAMAESGDVIHPELLNVHHYHKPPFTYAITALAYKIFGVNPFAARFFLLLALLIQIYCVFRLGQRLFPNQQQLAILSAMVYAAIPLVLISTRNLTTDAYLTTFVLLSCLQWVAWRQDRKSLHLFLFALFMGLGFLTKGPLIVVFPLSFIVGYNWAFPSNRKVSFTHLLAVMLFLGIALSWFIVLIRENADFLNYFLGTHTVDRVASNKFSRSEPFWYYLAFGTATAMPWVPALIYLLFKNNINWKPKGNAGWALGFSILVPLIILSIVSSKLVFYILPFFGFYSLFFVYFLLKSDKKIQKRIEIGVFVWFLVLFISLIIGPFIMIDDLVISKLFIGVGITGLIALLWVWFSTKWVSPVKIAIGGLTTLLLLLSSSTFFFQQNELGINALSPVAKFLEEKVLDEKQVLVYNRLLPSLAFHLEKDVVFINENYDRLIRETDFEPDEDWKNYFLEVGEADAEEKLRQYLAEGAVLITRYHNSPFFNDLTSAFEHKEQLGKWWVYY